MSVDAVVVNFESDALVRDLVPAVHALAGAEVSLRLFVVDCSGSLDLDSPHVTVLDPRGNVGFGQGVNAGAAKGRGELILLLNPDVRLRPDGLKALFSSMIGDVVAATGTLLNDDGSVQRNTGPRLTLATMALEYLLGRDTRFPPTDHRRQVEVMTGALLVVRREAFEKVGGFDAAFPLYVEDVVLSDALRELGELVQIPDVVGSHTGGASAASAPDVTWVLLHASRVRYFQARSALAGRLARAMVVLGCSLRWLVLGRRPLRALVRATSPSNDLAALLPSSSRARSER